VGEFTEGLRLVSVMVAIVVVVAWWCGGGGKLKEARSEIIPIIYIYIIYIYRAFYIGYDIH